MAILTRLFQDLDSSASTSDPAKRWAVDACSLTAPAGWMSDSDAPRTATPARADLTIVCLSPVDLRLSVRPSDCTDRMERHSSWYLLAPLFIPATPLASCSKGVGNKHPGIPVWNRVGRSDLTYRGETWRNEFFTITTATASTGVAFWSAWRGPVRALCGPSALAH